MTESLMATYNFIVHPIINYAAPVWFTQVSSYHLDKLEVIQNRALRIATCCHQKASVSHIKAETGVLPRLHTMNCAHNSSMKELSTSPPPPSSPRPLRATLQAPYHWTLRGLRVDDHNAPTIFYRVVQWEGSYPLARRLRMIGDILTSQAPKYNMELSSFPSQKSKISEC